MKKLAIVMSFAIILTSTFPSGNTLFNNDKSTPSALNAPIYQKLDPEMVKYAREKGMDISDVQKKQSNGKAYFKPDKAVDVVNGLNMKGKDNKGIAILVDFPVTEGKISDVPGVIYNRIPSDYFDDLLNGETYDPYKLDVFKGLATYTDSKTGEVYTAPTDRTMRNYYTEVSYGEYQIDVEVVDWVTLPHTYEYYMGQSKGFANVNGDAFIGQLVYDAIKAAEDDVNFEDYAIDATEIEKYEDGTLIPGDDGKPVTKIVPNIFIIHRGTGAEYSADPSIIWSHKWDIMSAQYFGYMDQNNGTPMDEKLLKYTTVDGVAVNTYNICPEVGRDITGFRNGTKSPPSPAYPGVYAHEFGHVLGLPDQYDYGYDSEGTGMYTLMAGGSYGRSIPNGMYTGNSPVHMDAWSKVYLGFVEPKVVTKTQKLSIEPSYSDADVYKIDVPGSNGREYFLLENRQQGGFDKGLAYMDDGENTHGLAVYHIVNDILARNFRRPNEAQNWDSNHRSSKFKDADTGENHYGISLIQADGKYDMERYNNDGDSGDLFPGKMGVTSLGSSFKEKINTLSLYRWNTKNNETGIQIKNIVEKDGVVTCDVVIPK